MQKRKLSESSRTIELIQLVSDGRVVDSNKSGSDMFFVALVASSPVNFLQAIVRGVSWGFFNCRGFSSELADG